MQISDEDEEVLVRTPLDVAQRALALSAVTLRAFLELESSDNWENAARSLDKIHSWIKGEGISKWLSDEEQEYFDDPLGEFDDDVLLNWFWRQEALVALLWSLGKIESMPPYFRRTSWDSFAEVLPITQRTQDFLKCNLRPVEVLEQEQRRAQFWNWRMRTTMLQNQGIKPPPGDSFDKVIRRAAESALEEGLIDNIRDGDVDCDGVAYKNLPHEDFSEAGSTSIERHYGLAWVCGYGDDWDEVTADT